MIQYSHRRFRRHITRSPFFTPLATPAVPLMMGAGNYTMKDLVKMGWIPAIVITVVSVGWIMTVYPLF